MLTGESTLQLKKENDLLFCGTINSNGMMIMKVTKIPGIVIDSNNNNFSHYNIFSYS